ncbi:MAG TPA: hypothetical protein VK563_12760 [Puia sp.]|nr:hypothetical protein [Puia sp.]
MQSNLLDLFEMAKPEKRKTPEQKQFEKENLALLLAFKEIVSDSFRMLHDHIFTLIKPGGGMDNKMPSVTLISFIRTYIIQKFPAYCGKATKSRFKLVTPTQNNIYLKKLDFKRRPSNRKSTANDLIMYQLTKSNKDKGGNVFLGYVTDKVFSRVLGIYAVCLDGKECLWECDILALARKQETKVIRMKKRGEKLKLKDTAVPIKNNDDAKLE